MTKVGTRAGRTGWLSVGVVVFAAAWSEGGISYVDDHRAIDVEAFHFDFDPFALFDQSVFSEPFVPFDVVRDFSASQDWLSVRAMASQHSVLAPMFMSGSGATLADAATTEDLHSPPNVQATSSVQIRFEILEPTPYAFSARVAAENSNDPFGPSLATIALYGPELEPITGVSVLEGTREVFSVGELAPGSYVLDGGALASLFTDYGHVAATFEFTLSVPEPSSGVILLPLVVVLMRRRP